MTKQEREIEQMRKKIVACFAKWKWTLGLSLWEIKIEWTSSDQIPMPDAMTGHYAGVLAPQMSISPFPEYLLALVSVDPLTLIGCSDRELDEAVAHELVHAVLSEARIGDDDDQYNAKEDALHVRLEEKITTMLSRALVLAQDSGEAAERDRQKKQAKKSKVGR